ncbi:MAG TPA: hypothetical protein VHA56_04395 [Mucilaginibacter sp.]|nr:hypothetical protein [Mucilaginibacter sp.]
MDITDIIKTTITVTIAVFGWITAHYFSSKRDRTLKRREIISKHLIDTYKILAYEIVQREYSEEMIKKLELPLAELQLFGTKYQIDLAKKLAYDIEKGGDIDLNNLVNNLRTELRKELDLEAIEENIVFLRYRKK